MRPSWANSGISDWPRIKNTPPVEAAGTELWAEVFPVGDAEDGHEGPAGEEDHGEHPPAYPACDGSTGPALNLGLNREKWHQRGPADYAFEFHRSCFCLDTATFPVRITVRQGAVTEVVWIPGGEPIDAANVARFFNMTLDSLFGVVERAIAVGADRLSVDYDREYGYPTRVTIDYDTRTADEELALDARS